MTTKYTPGGLAVAIGKSSTVQLPPRVFRVRLTGLLFETDKTFLLPVAMHGIRGLVEYYQKHPNAKLVVTGHTDTVGDAAYNLALSDERAASVGHYLQDEVDAWLKCYQGSPHSKIWGTREDQHMLTAIVDDTGQPFYAGPVHGQLDAATRDAVTRYQTSRSLAVDGQPGPETRRSLCTDYMKLDGTTLPASATLEKLGCGENHPEVPTADNTDEPANRRVEIFLFDSPPEPPNPGTCPGPGCAYPEWKNRALDTVDFDHDLCELLVRCHDDDEQPLEAATVRLMRDGAVVHEQPTDAQGQALFRQLVAGQYRVHGEKKGFRAQHRDVEVVSGGIAGESDQNPSERHNLLGDDDGGSGSGGTSTGGNQPVQLQLDPDFSLIHVVGEHPVDKITNDVKEGAKNDFHQQPWRRLEGSVEYSRETVPLQFDVNGKAFPTGEDPPGKLTFLGVHEPHVWPLRYRIWNKDGTQVLTDPAVEAGKTLEVQLSTRVRFSILHFFVPFISLTKAKSLDDDLLKLLGAAHVDDISIVSVVKFVDDPKNPRIEFTKEWWPMDKADYCRKLIAACRPMGVQVVLGWGAVDKGKAIQHKDLVDFLSVADDAQIQILAQNIARFFFDEQKLDIDGFMFDFELNGLGPPNEMPADADGKAAVNARVARQANNVRLLYRKTAEAIAQRKDDAFVSYCNTPLKADNEDVVAFMRVQGFDLLADCPNLIARPMCFFVDTIPADDIRASVKYAVTHDTDPAQLQYAVYASQLKSEFDNLLTDTFRANRVGVILYQFPGVTPDVVNEAGKTEEEIATAKQAATMKAARASRPRQEKFLEAAAQWNATLNEGESVPSEPPVPGQPIQVPRRTP